MRRTLLISDSHFRHISMKTYCDRPADFTERIIKNWHNLVAPDDLVIHLGDVAIGKREDWKWIIPSLPGRKILIRGNHDDQKSCDWWTSEGGFDFACDGMIYRGIWLTHKPAKALPEGCMLNVHGHLHNIWHGFHPDDPDKKSEYGRQGKLQNSWQRLFAVEYTGYRPIEFNEFLSHPNRYNARGLTK